MPTPRPSHSQPNSVFRRYRPPSFRLWHWATSTVISGLLLTVVLRSTLFREQNNVAGSMADARLARKVTNVLVDRLWGWHVNLGYALTVLLVLRAAIWLRFGGGRTGDFADLKKAIHFKCAGALYSAFYAVTIFMVFSGLTMVYSARLHLSDVTVEKIRGIHEVLKWFFFGFVGLHISGVVWAELSNEKGLVSDMIHGGQDNQ